MSLFKVGDVVSINKRFKGQSNHSEDIGVVTCIYPNSSYSITVLWSPDHEHNYMEKHLELIDTQPLPSTAQLKKGILDSKRKLVKIGKVI